MTKPNKYSYGLLFAFFNLCIILILLALPAGVKVEVRNAFISKKVDKNIFEVDLKEFKKTGLFKWYSEDIKEQFGQRTYFKTSVSDLVKLKMDDSSLVQNLVLLFSKNGSNKANECGLYSNNLEENIKWLNTNEGHGCCSDHAQVFIALGTLAGLTVREVHNDGHTFNEYWDRQLNKWVWVDPQFWLMAKNNEDSLLSLFDIQDLFSKNEFPTFYSFKNNGKYIDNLSMDEVFRLYYTAKNFNVIRMTSGNNIFVVDKYNSFLKFLPKSVVQTILLASGIQPCILYSESKPILENKYNRYIFSFLGFGLLFLIVNIFLLKNTFQKKDRSL